MNSLFYKESRPYQLINSDIDPNVLYIGFKTIGNCKPQKYLLKYQIEIKDKIVTYDTHSVTFL